MLSTTWSQRTVTLHPVHLMLALACVMVAGVLIGVNLPFGSKPLTVTKGVAAFTSDGGTFQADRGGVTAWIPTDVMWKDASGTSHPDGIPPCLAIPPGEAVAHAPVEAGYAWLSNPDGGGTPVVGWLRCL